jgi:hypothetical protein
LAKAKKAMHLLQLFFLEVRVDQGSDHVSMTWGNHEVAKGISRVRRKL